MDGLLAEINSKRKALEVPGGDAGPSKKYLRRSELEAAREEEERKAKAIAAQASAENKAAKMRTDVKPSSSTSAAPVETGKETFNISPEECVRRLRAKGQPIRLFGETDKDRRLRLRALELQDDRDKSQTDFKKAMDTMTSEMLEKAAEKHARSAQVGQKDKEKEEKEEKKRFVDLPLVDLSLVKTDINKLYPQIYWAFKSLLREWGEWLEARDDTTKNTAAGKMAAAAQVQSAQNLKPLFRLLRQRDMPPDVVRALAQMVHYMQIRAYQKANDAYLRMSIGNAAWPIGVTSVGIHERSALEKIYSDKVGHVLNDELSRKYIQAVKRLMTFNQTVRPPDDNAHAVG
ncbi:hypothetical protein TREMEDRAFT_35832 [Tremella mesenterica DSM 1558]|uniref:uncharacterized protein n=1 Tax=Tremella mesenterica (strain ATCC 24925 / CBS 8224 / DSM 1558 / NBRC 9311 / NRRL Y-6157 / RJB 2259-6 / UBC 559-6) TaxID=578456 RepID=UPI00032CC360|nr:uncharacterized protein TREMEDRAFT_35832 [Tremella mesenterica DSM 1558]EIW65765.1 hypothetical protein TREMEDRAFT_35832 [Tremella mesenterica DSM 1558]